MCYNKERTLQTHCKMHTLLCFSTVLLRALPESEPITEVNNLIRDILYILCGYLGGSILFARVFGRLIKKCDIREGTKDSNPGTANAFMKGGFWCGVITLIFDVGKGFLPVFLYTRGETSAIMALVMAAPVVGHVFPVFFRFRGGKGIATTFGCLIGLLPEYAPLVLLAVTFIFFSVVVRVSPHYYRTLLTYICTEILMFIFVENIFITIGFTLILMPVYTRMLTSKEERAKWGVKILWMH